MVNEPQTDGSLVHPHTDSSCNGTDPGVCDTDTDELAAPYDSSNSGDANIQKNTQCLPPTNSEGVEDGHHKAAASVAAVTVHSSQQPLTQKWTANGYIGTGHVPNGTAHVIPNGHVVPPQQS